MRTSRGLSVVTAGSNVASSTSKTPIALLGTLRFPTALASMRRVVARPRSRFDPSRLVIGIIPASRNASTRRRVVVVLPFVPVTNTEPLGIADPRLLTSPGSIACARSPGRVVPPLPRRRKDQRAAWPTETASARRTMTPIRSPPHPLPSAGMRRRCVQPQPVAHPFPVVVYLGDSDRMIELLRLLVITPVGVFRSRRDRLLETSSYVSNARSLGATAAAIVANAEQLTQPSPSAWRRPEISRPIG